MFNNGRIPPGYYLAIPIGVMLIIFGFISSQPNGADLWDFGLFHLCALQASQGLNPYGSVLFMEMVDKFKVTLVFPNLNPPFAIFVYERLLTSNPVTAFAIWWYLSLALYSFSIIFCFLKYNQSAKGLSFLWPFCWAAIWMTLSLGQIYTILLPLILFTYRALEREKWVQAGIVIGVIVAFKPNFVLWPVALYLVGFRRCAISAVLASMLLSTLPIIQHGFSIYEQWFATMGTLPNYQMATSVSITSLVAHFLPKFGWVNAVLSILLGVCVLIVLARRKPSASSTSEVAIWTVLAVSPVAWLGYMLFLLPSLLSRKGDRLFVVGLCLFCLPANMILQISKYSDPWHHFAFLVYPVALGLIGISIFKDIGMVSLVTAAQQRSPKFDDAC